MEDIIQELSRFDDGFTPSSLDIEAGLDTLPDGEYQLEIVSGDLVRTEKTREAIFRLKVRVLAGPYAGNVVERPSFLKSQQSINILGGDLVAIGFDANKWKLPHRPFSTEFAKILPKLAGIKFAGRKATNKEGYHNLYVRNRLGAAPIKPPASAQRPAPAAAAVPAGDPVPF